MTRVSDVNVVITVTLFYLLKVIDTWFPHFPPCLANRLCTGSARPAGGETAPQLTMKKMVKIKTLLQEYK